MRLAPSFSGSSEDSRLLAIRPAPFGRIELWGTPDDLHRVQLGAECPANEGFLIETLSVSNLLKALDAYLNHSASPLPLPPLQQGTPFQQRVWHAIRAIPLGETRCYGDLAAHLESHPRAVARACGLNPFPLLTPCHRVVSQSGLGGFMQGMHPSALSIKRWLLAHEAR